ncbi:MAG: hypothetical protein NC918_02595 [Candidatus Omnitrophica bacterium]|nr:hypothetical protein [Candidatus Omnitrophota bacterium]
MNYYYTPEALIITDKDKEELKEFLNFLATDKEFNEWFSENWIRYNDAKGVHYIKFFGKMKAKISVLDLKEFENKKKGGENNDVR